MQTANPSTVQQTLHVNPTNEERRTTNGSCLIIFMFIILFWICTIIKVFTDDTLPENYSNSTGDSGNMTIVSQSDAFSPSFTWKFLLCIIISGAIAVAYTFLLSQDEGKFIVYVGMFLLCSQTVGIVSFAVLMLAFMSLVSSHLSLSSTVLILFSVLILLVGVYFVISCRSARNVGMQAIFEIIRDSCRAIRTCPSISIFTCVMSVVIILIMTLFLYLTKRIMITECSSSVSKFYLIVNTYCAITVFFFLINFTHMVISGYIIDWFWSNDRNSTTVTIRHSLERTLRFHMGTVAFFSTPFLPHIYSIFAVCRHRDSDNDITKRYDIFTRVSGQFRMFVSIMDYSLIQTSIYGHECKTAIMAAHNLVSQNNHELFLAVSEVSDKVILFGMTLLAIPYSVEHIHYSAYSFIVPLYIALTSAIRTLLVDKMIVNYTSGALKEENNSAHSYTVL